mgnify:CR=1 FL=1
MSGNTFGTLFTVTSFGESHGPAIGAVLEGVPAGLPLDMHAIAREMERRAPGRDLLSTARREEDEAPGRGAADRGGGVNHEPHEGEQP